MNSLKIEGTRAGGSALLLAIALCLSGCIGHLADRPQIYRAHKTKIERQEYVLKPVLVKPVTSKRARVLILFASGDGGLWGLSKTILQHLADDGYYVAGFSSREAIREIKGWRQRIPYGEAVDQLAWITSDVKAKLGLPPDTPIIVTGLSRGASLVIFAASSREMRNQIIGAVAIALTRDLEYISPPAPAMNGPAMEMDEEEHPQTYPAIRHLGTIPLAIIQSTKDHYVPSGESRKLLGPDTPTRRLYEVKSSGHNFGGGEAIMMHDLDDALAWIIDRPSKPSAKAR